MPESVTPVSPWVARGIIAEVLSERLGRLKDTDHYQPAIEAMLHSGREVFDALCDAGIIVASDQPDTVQGRSELTDEWSPGDVIVTGDGSDPRILDRRKDDGDGWWLTDGSGLSNTAIGNGGWQTTRELARTANNWAALFDEGITYRDVESKIDNGQMSIRMISDGPVSHATTKFVAGLLLNVLLGEERVEPDNYRSCTIDIQPADEWSPFRVHMEVVKPGGKSSHDIRRDLERKLEELGS